MDKDPTTTEPTPEKWADFCREFFEITTEILDMRQEYIKQEFAREDLDYEVAMQSYDVEEEAKSQVTPEARAYAGLYQALCNDESNAVTRMTKLSSDDFSIAFLRPNAVWEQQGVTEDGIAYSDVTSTFVAEGKIWRNKIRIPGGEYTDEMFEMLDYARDNNALDPTKPLTLQETESFMRYLKVSRRYIGQLLYGREPQPGDPA